jgi:hypothetical protein
VTVFHAVARILRTLDLEGRTSVQPAHQSVHRSGVASLLWVILLGFSFCVSCRPSVAPSAISWRAPKISILHDDKLADAPVVVLMLDDVEQLVVAGSDCTMKNLTVTLYVAEKVTITESDGRIVVHIHEAREDMLPFYPNASGVHRDGVSRIATWEGVLDPAGAVRINGETMTLKAAAQKFPELGAKSSDRMGTDLPNSKPY